MRLSRSTPKRPYCTITNADDLLFQREEDPIIVWDNGSLRSSCSQPKRPTMHDDLTPIETHCWAHAQYTGTRNLKVVTVLDPTQSRHIRVHHMRTNRCLTSPQAKQPLLEFTRYEPSEAQAENAQTLNKNNHTRLPSKKPEVHSVSGTSG